MKLTKTDLQSDAKGADDSTMAITVEYDPAFCEVTKLISIEVYNCKSQTLTDITWIFREQHPAALETLISEIPWYDLYQERNRSQFKVHDAGVVVHDSVDMIKELQDHFR